MGKLQSKQQKQQMETTNENKEKELKLGGYQQNNLKQGIWIEEIQIIRDKLTKVFEIGEYHNGQKRGNWKYIYNDKRISGGSYDDKGQKKGKWIILGDSFYEQLQIFQNGDYSIKSMKVGIWEVYIDRNSDYKIIGFGSYDQQGSQNKVGKWIELDERFRDNQQVTHIGQYNKNGVKVGRWDIQLAGEFNIGGGSYDQEGKEIKISQWIELDQHFRDYQYITNKGQYHKNGMKVDRWEIYFDQSLIGGGSYNQDGSQIKIGKWIELDQQFHSQRQITSKGEYNKNGIKVGRWEIYFDQSLIGGGSYDQDGGQLKIGKWIELDQEFRYQRQVTNEGEYNKKGMKVDKWDIYFEQQLIGGGSYDQDGGQIKIGKWIELHEQFKINSILILIGDYNKKGMKIGRWDTWYKGKLLETEYKKIGGGQYDSQGNSKKIGQWIEMDERLYGDLNINYIGQYNQQGIKVGKWEIIKWDQLEKSYNKIGEGQFCSKGSQKKIGQWLDLELQSDYDVTLAYKGKFNQKGLKVGRWDIMIWNDYEKQYNKIGGGSYDFKGDEKKIGHWIEFIQDFAYQEIILQNGDYNLKGMKVGRWTIFVSRIFEDYHYSIGGGEYDQEGNQKKIGKWVELKCGASLVTFIGEYNQKGKKMGKWVEFNIYNNMQIGERKYEI